MIAWINTLEEAEWYRNHPAFIPVHKYVTRGHLKGEIGSIGLARLVVVWRERNPLRLASASAMQATANGCATIDSYERLAREEFSRSGPGMCPPD